MWLFHKMQRVILKLIIILFKILLWENCTAHNHYNSAMLMINSVIIWVMPQRKAEVPCYPSDRRAAFSTTEDLKSDQQKQLDTQQDLSFHYQQVLRAKLLTQHSLLMQDAGGCTELMQLESTSRLLSAAVNQIRIWNTRETNSCHTQHRTILAPIYMPFNVA